MHGGNAYSSVGIYSFMAAFIECTTRYLDVPKLTAVQTMNLNLINNLMFEPGQCSRFKNALQHFRAEHSKTKSDCEGYI